MELEPMRVEGLIAIGDRRNGAAPHIEIRWERIQEMTTQSELSEDAVSPHDETREPGAQVDGQQNETREPDAQVDGVNGFERVSKPLTCANDARHLRKTDPPPAQTEPLTCALSAHKGFKGLEGLKKRAGSREALTPLPGSTLSTEESEGRKRFCEEIRPEWARKA